MNRTPAILLLTMLAALAAAGASAGPGVVPTGFQDVLVAGGLRWPVAIAMLPDNRVLVTEQFTGRIRLLVGNGIAAVDPVCTVPGVRNNPGSEQGLLGIAIDPGWPLRPYVYVHYDHATTPTIHLSRFTVTGDLNFATNGSLSIDPASRYDLITDIPDNASNHNGGTLRFGPDHMLYVSLGEDAAPCAAQDTTSLRGKILRLDVSGLPAGPGGPPPRSAITPAGNPFASHPDLNARLVWALGLRNPFRFTIDQGGVLFVADVGEGAWEEIDRLPAGGLDLGWPLFEGDVPYTTCAGVTGSGMTGPIYTFQHLGGSYAVIGGPVLQPTCATIVSGPSRGGVGEGRGASESRDADLPGEYFGNYFFSEYYHGFLRRLVGSGNSWSLALPVAGQPNPTDWGTGFNDVSDWATDCLGRMYYCRQSVGFLDNTGEIRRITIPTSTGVPPLTPGLDFRPPWPSPAHGRVYFDFTLPAESPIELGIYDGRGRLVRRLVAPRVESAGSHREVWDGRDAGGRGAPPGLYFARLRVAGRDLVRRFPRL
jgi:glucose/arabinose dehydrogenase